MKKRTAKRTANPTCSFCLLFIILVYYFFSNGDRYNLRKAAKYLKLSLFHFLKWGQVQFEKSN